MTNTFEGGLFVNPNFSAQATLADFVAQLFPLFNDDQIQATLQVYENTALQTVTDQTIAVMGECERFGRVSGFNA